MSHKNSRLSVGVPAYNQGNFLGETIESLLRQNLAPKEIVVSNNWSTDDTESVAKSFGARIKLVRPPYHLAGVTHWNFLASQLEGEWFSLLSSDDVALPNFVEEMEKGIDVSLRSVLVRAGIQLIDGNSSILDTRLLLSVAEISGFPDNFYAQLGGPKVSFAAFAVSKLAWSQSGGFPEDLYALFDWAFWLRLSSKGDFITRRTAVSQYRVNYRPNLEYQRFMGELGDDVLICTQLIPELASIIPDVKTSRLKVQSKNRFIARLHRANQLFRSAAERSTVADIVRPWAVACGEEAILEDFVYLAKSPRPRNFHGLKNILRKMYQYYKLNKS